MSYLKACKLSEIEEGQTKMVHVGGKPVLLARDKDQVYGIAGYCTHDGGDLEGAELIGAEIECPRHGARFDIHTGKVTQMPAVYGLATYAVKVEGEDILVSLTD